MAEVKPVAKYGAGSVVGSIWQNINNENQVYYTVQIERIYKDKEGKWQGTNSYRVTDLPKLEMVARKCSEFLILKDKLSNENKVITEQVQE